MSGAQRSEIDLNGVDDSTLSNVTANGNGTAGVGIALSDSTGITLENIATTGNGGLWNARQVVALAQAAKLGILLGSIGIGSADGAIDLETADVIAGESEGVDLEGMRLELAHVKADVAESLQVGMGGAARQGQQARAHAQ